MLLVYNNSLSMAVWQRPQLSEVAALAGLAYRSWLWPGPASFYQSTWWFSVKHELQAWLGWFWMLRRESPAENDKIFAPLSPEYTVHSVFIKLLPNEWFLLAPGLWVMTCFCLGEFGQNKPPWFCLLPRYWCNQHVQPEKVKLVIDEFGDGAQVGCKAVWGNGC